MALRIPFDLLSALLVKKPTVSGTMGNIHGRKNAAIPAKRPNPKVTHKEGVFCALSKVGFITALSVFLPCSFVVLTGVKSRSSGTEATVVSVCGAMA